MPQVLTIALATGLSILIARAIGSGGLGIFVLPILLAAIGSAAFDGLADALSRAIAAGRRRGALRAAFLAVVPLVVAAALVALAIGFAVRQFWAVPYAIVALPFLAIAALASGYARGLGDARSPSWVALANVTLMLALVGAGFWFEGLQASVAIVAWLAANVVTGIACLLRVMILARCAGGQSVSARPFFAESMRSAGLGVVDFFSNRLGLFVVAILLSVAALGFYSIAVAGGAALLLAAQLSLARIAPRTDKLPRREAALLTARSVRTSALLSSSMTVVAVVLSPFIVLLLYGLSFASAIAPLEVLCVGANALAVIVVVSAYYTENARRPMVPLLMQGVSIGISLALSVELVPGIGIVGAAIAASVSYLVCAGVLLVYFSRETKIPLRDILIVQRGDLEWMPAKLFRRRVTSGSTALRRTA